MKRFITLFIFITNFHAADNKVPFIYHPEFNASFLRLAELYLPHAHQAADIVELLKKHFHWTDDQFHEPRRATDAELKRFHTREYISSLNQAWKEFIARAMGVVIGGALFTDYLQNNPAQLAIFTFYALCGLRPSQARAYSQGITDNTSLTIPLMIFGPLLLPYLINPIKLAVNGTDLAVKKALDKNGPGWCVNLLGGYTHALTKKGGGFCLFNDIACALQEQITQNDDFKALIIDCGPRFGNGNAEFALGHPGNVTIIDIYDGLDYPFAFPQSIALESLIQYPNPVISDADISSWNTNRPAPIIKRDKNSDWYCDLVKQNLKKVKSQHFDCIIFTAGYKLNYFGLTKEQTIKRDATVCEFARKYKVPFVQVLQPGSCDPKIVAGCLINNYKIMQRLK